VAVHPELIEILRCPRCHGLLALRADGAALECAACRLLYPVVDDIPQLLIDEAKPLEA
jgi:uncharacterized protein YbaR (Trm112 family)